MLQNSLDLLVNRWDWFVELFIEHMSISLTAIFFSTVIGLLLGIFISEKQGAAKVTLSIVNILYTIPSLALLGLLIPLTGAGTTTAIIALTLYGLLPIVKNTHTGITNIDPALIEASEGMGSTRFQMLIRVKLPLALPVIMSGFRNMVTMTISLTTIAAYIGAGGLGTAIFRGISNNNMAMVFVASVITAVLAVVIDLILGAVEKRLYRNRSHKSYRRTVVAIVVVLIIAAVLVAGVQIYNRIQESRTLRVTGMSYTEQSIMGSMLQEYIEENTNLNVEFDSVSAGTVANTGLLYGDYDCYVEYTGTVWSDYLQQDGVYHEDMFEDMVELYEEQGLVWVNKLGFNNTYAVAVPEDWAEKNDVETYSDLAPYAEDMTLGASPIFFEHEGDGYADYCETYGYEFGDTSDLDQGLIYKAIKNDEVDAIVVYSTDGQLVDSGLRVLEDDLGYFPSYQAGVVTRQDVLEEHPELEDLFMKLSDTLDDATMQEMNYEVDTEGESPEDVAHDYLVENGLVEE